MIKRNRFHLGWIFVLLLYGWVDGQDSELHIGKPFETRGRMGRSEFAKTAFDSSHAFDVLHYRLDLTFPYTSGTLSGTVTATCLSNESDLDEVSFHMVDLVADSVICLGERLSVTQTAEEINISLNHPVAAGDTFNITIAYHGSPQERGFYFYEMCAYTFAEPVDARRWFPCYDVPWDKATAELHITVPRGVEVASIGLLEGRELIDDGIWETFHWRSVYPVATYLICVTMSDNYSRWSDWYITSEGDSIEIAYYIFTRDSAKARQDFVNMVAAMAFFSDRFGPYPFEKYGMAEVEPVSFGGMEHQTMTTINSVWVRGDRSIETGLVHELAHMWWGDAVTLNDWPAIWLNEGFAVYSEALFREHQYGWSDFRDYMDNSKSIYVSRTEQYDYPIYDPYYIFDYGIIYKKGAWILHMLRHVVGEENFRTILNTYYKTYRYTNASIPEFQAVCETISAMDLDWFFQEWIYDMGYPKVQYSWEKRSVSSDLYEITLVLNQYHSVGPVFRMPVDVRLVGAASSIDTSVWMENANQSFTFLTDNRPVDILIDPDGWILMGLEYMAGGSKRSEAMPDMFALHKNFPNPFNEATTIHYNIPDFNGAQWEIRIVVYDLLGRLVRTVFKGLEMPGSYRIVWDGQDDRGWAVPTGVYIIEFSTDGFTQRRKAVLVR